MRGLFLFVPLIAIWIYRRRRSIEESVSAQWVRDRARQDEIEAGQYQGFVKWPWNVEN